MAANMRAEYKVSTDENAKRKTRKMYRLLGREIKSFQEEYSYPLS